MVRSSVRSMRSISGNRQNCPAGSGPPGADPAGDLGWADHAFNPLPSAIISTSKAARWPKTIARNLGRGFLVRIRIAPSSFNGEPRQSIRDGVTPTSDVELHGSTFVPDLGLLDLTWQSCQLARPARTIARVRDRSGVVHPDECRLSLHD